MAERCKPGTSKMAEHCKPGTSKMAERCKPGTSKMAERCKPGTSKMAERCKPGTSKMAEHCKPGTSKMAEKAPESETEEEESSSYESAEESGEEAEEDPNIPEELLLQRLALGDDKKLNQALYAPPMKKFEPQTAFEDDFEHRTGIKLREPPTIVFYFGGDMQNFRNEMGNSPEDKYVRDRYSLEATVLALRHRFQHSAIVAIQPAIMNEKLYAIYGNFYDVSDNMGTPIYSEGNDSLTYLVNLIVSIFEETDTFASFARIALVGFSKGVCVLNQLLISLHNSEHPLPGMTPKFRWAITELYFLDSGHCGKSGAWINDVDIINSLASYAAIARVYPLPVRVGVTAFQIEFKRRTRIAPWIAEEEENFCHLIERFAEERVPEELQELLGKYGGPKPGEKVQLLDLKRLYCRAGKSIPKANEGEYYLRMHFAIIDKLVAGEL